MLKFKTTCMLAALVFGGCRPQSENRVSENKPLSIIFMVGDGMGLTQVSTTFYFQDKPSSFERFSTIGLSKTACTSHKVTDSAAGATAFSIGQKTYKGAIGVTEDTVAAPTILEDLEKQGYKTGLVCLTTITHATPASFYAHVKDRNMHETIASFLPASGVDFFAGGGLQFFNQRSDQQDLYEQLQKQYHMDTTSLAEQVSPANKYGFLLAQNEMPGISEGRGDYLPDATSLALSYFDQSKAPFFLMVEGSFVDWAGHQRNKEMLIKEMQDFDQTLEVALDYVESHENVLLVVTADHETGGAAMGKLYKEGVIRTHALFGKNKKIEDPTGLDISFNTDQHTATAVPVFAKGQGEALFAGIYENNEIYHKMKEVLGQ